MFGEIDSLISIIERLRKFLGGRSRSSLGEMVSTRIVNVCEAHGIHRNQIPRVFGLGLSVYDVASDARFLRKVDEDLIVAIAAKIGVKRDWLEGASSKIYPTYAFYKQPELFRSFLLDKLEGAEDISGVLLFPEEGGRLYGALLLLQETAGYLDGQPFYKYHLCDNWSHEYWKARAYLTACIAICWKNGVYVQGRFVPGKMIEDLEDAEGIIKFGEDGIYSIRGRRWHCEDMVSSPEVFLSAVGPENENYGVIEALKYWIELHDKGFMDDGFNDSAARSRFVDRLNQII
ncbi:hypothetical protein K8B33_09860 [Alcanivorax sp. JB21]|uniref:hypothetical protein n=1 Tax=Alcanivorax limicola TaxID=2874102 RepID=UPI001CBBB6D5|nr:hypothetical protein [Alcanivorax limicola]MBZ2189401.1 hypothetical protein [Alcanivorax limicola]